MGVSVRLKSPSPNKGVLVLPKTSRFSRRKSQRGRRTGLRSGTVRPVAPRGPLSGLNRAVLPSFMDVVLAYCDCGSLPTVATTGVFSELNWALNSLYDPHTTFGGHQPYMYDQFAALYSQYRVLKARIIFTMVPDNFDGVVVTGFPRISGDTTALSGLNVPYMEFPSAKTGLATAAIPFTVDYTANIWEMLGVTKDRYLADPNYVALISASPTPAAWYTLMWANPLASTGAKNNSYTVRIEFVARLTGLKTQSFS